MTHHSPTPENSLADGHGLTAEIAGYLRAEQILAPITTAHQAATARALLHRYAAAPTTAYGRGFRTRLIEATVPARRRGR